MPWMNTFIAWSNLNFHQGFLYQLYQYPTCDSLRAASFSAWQQSAQVLQAEPLSLETVSLVVQGLTWLH